MQPAIKCDLMRRFMNDGRNGLQGLGLGKDLVDLVPVLTLTDGLPAEAAPVKSYIVIRLVARLK